MYSKTLFYKHLLNKNSCLKTKRFPNFNNERPLNQPAKMTLINMDKGHFQVKVYLVLQQFIGQV